MRRAEILEGVRMLKLRDVLSRWEAKQISQLEVAELMGVSERTFRRWTRPFEEEGEAGVVDRRLGKPSPRRVPAVEAERVAELYRTRYGGFAAKHFHERLVGVHGFNWGYTWTKTFLHGQGLLAPAPLRGAGRTAASLLMCISAVSVHRHRHSLGRSARGMAQTSIW